MKLVFGSLLLMVATAVAAAVPPRFPTPNNPIATAPEPSSPSSSGPQDPTSVVSVSTSDPTGTDTSRNGSSGPVPSTDVSSSTDTSAPTSPASIQHSSTEVESQTSTSQTSSTDSLSSTDNAPTITPGRRSTTSDRSSITSTDVRPPSSTPSPSSSTAPSRPITTPPAVDKQTYLDQHNRWRALFGAEDLQWSDDLAAKAQGYAAQCQLQHSNGALGQVGENLVAATGSFNAMDAMSQFVLDINDLNFGDVTLSHFTQVIWSSTTQLGCGVAVCDEMFPGHGAATYHVCLYDPVGNVVGEIKSNLPHFR